MVKLSHRLKKLEKKIKPSYKKARFFYSLAFCDQKINNNFQFSKRRNPLFSSTFQNAYLLNNAMGFTAKQEITNKSTSNSALI